MTDILLVTGLALVAIGVIVMLYGNDQNSYDIGVFTSGAGIVLLLLHLGG